MILLVPLIQSKQNYSSKFSNMYEYRGTNNSKFNMYNSINKSKFNVLKQILLVLLFQSKQIQFQVGEHTSSSKFNI